MDELSREFLHECLFYDKDSGMLTWKVRPLEHFKNEIGVRAFNSRFAGKNISSVRAMGRNKYFIVGLLTTTYLAHKIIYKMLVDERHSSSDIIDHIDGNGLNNRLDNLRLTTTSKNQRNTRLWVTNKSGFKGVSFDKRRGKWVASIYSKKNQAQFLGRFDNLSDAVKARIDAEDKYGYTHIIS